MIQRLLLRLGGGLALSAAVAALGPATAGAFVRYRTKTGNPYAWGVASVPILGYPRGIPTMTVDEITTAMTAAVSAWSNEDPTNATCSFLSLGLTMRPETEVPPVAAHDEINVIALRDGCWTCICSMTKDGRQDCHERGELALTTVWSRPCGEIVEADVEVNAEISATDFSWADLVIHPDLRGDGQNFHDLQNALTHEMGHLIGLDHTCYLQPPAPLDNTGTPIPDCASAPPDVLATTMFPSANPGDIDKRDLAPDDQNAVCEIYPAAQDPKTCSPGETEPKGCSCATGGEPVAALGPFVMLAAALLAVRARRRRGA